MCPQISSVLNIDISEEQQPVEISNPPSRHLQQLSEHSVVMHLFKGQVWQNKKRPLPQSDVCF